MLTLLHLNRRHKAGLFLVLIAAGLSLFFEVSVKQTAGIVLLGLAAAWFFGSVRPRTLGIILASTACCTGLYLVIAPIWNDRELYRTQAQAYDQALLDIRKAITSPAYDVLARKYGGTTEERGPWKQIEDLTEDQDFQTLPLVEKKKVLLAIGGNKITFQSPTTGRRKDLPIDQWDDALRLGYHPSVPKDWFAESAPRTVQIPTSAIYCLRPDKKGSEWDTETITFPVKMPEEEILRAFQDNMLIPRPTFSLRAVVRTHLLSSAAGGLLFLLGLLGLILLIWKAFGGKSETAIQRA